LIGYWGSLVFYNSYLPDIAYVEQQDKISAKGYSLGYRKCNFIDYQFSDDYETKALGFLGLMVKQL
jgi:hypothetical protein